GCQHTTVPELQLPFFCGAGEAEWAPLPDVVLCSGRHAVEALRRGGLPERLLKLAGSRRYAHLRGRKPLPDSGERDVLVILPIDADQAEHMLAALRRAFPRGGEGFRFLVKTHPAERPPRGLRGFDAGVLTGPLDEALARCGRVLFCGTSSGIEALSLGLPTLRYRAESLVDLDPADLLGEEELPTAGDADLREKLEALGRA